MSGTARLVAVAPQFTVADVVHTCTYYREVLGFTIEGYWDGERATADPPADPRFAIVARDAVQLFFNCSDSDTPPRGRAAGAYDVFVTVTGVDALAADRRGRGAEVLEGPADRVYGRRELVIRDCNGLVIAFAEAAIRTEP